MRKILLAVVAVLSCISVMAEQKSTDLVKYVPDGTNVVMYINTGELLNTEFMSQLRKQDTKLDYIVDGIKYYEEELGLGDEAVNSLMLCRDTSKAVASFYLLNTAVPKDNFETVFVADYGYFNSSAKKSIPFGGRNEVVEYFELGRQSAPGELSAAVYISDDMVTIVPVSYLTPTLKNMQNPPIRGEVATATSRYIKQNAMATLVADLNNSKSPNLISWDRSLDGANVVDIIFNLVGEEEDIEVLAYFYCSSDADNTNATSAKFANNLRAAKEEWLNAKFGYSNEALRAKIDKCISIVTADIKVTLEVKMPHAVYAELSKFDPNITNELLDAICLKFQLMD